MEEGSGSDDHHVVPSNSMMRRLVNNFVVNETTLQAAASSSRRAELKKSSPPLLSSDSEADMTNDEESSQDEFHKCLKCNASPIKSRLTHIKQNVECKEFYMAKYGVQNLKEMSAVFTAENKSNHQKRKRKDPKYRQKMNKKLKEKRNMKKIEVGTMMKEYREKVNSILSVPCAACKSYSSPSVVELVDDGEFYVQGKNQYMCRYCKNIEKGLEDWMVLEGFDEEKFTDYEDWARTNFSLSKRLSQMLAKITSASPPRNVAILVYYYEGKRFVVAHPSTSEQFNVVVEKGIADAEEVDPTILLPAMSRRELKCNSFSPEEVELAMRSSTDCVNMLSVLFETRISMIVHEDRRRTANSAEVKKGLINGRSVQMVDVKGNQGSLKDIKGTADYLETQRNDILWRQAQNGKRSLCLKWPVFYGFKDIQYDPSLALTVLRTRGYKFQTLERKNEDGTVKNDCRALCHVDCNPFNCWRTEYHQTPLEKFKTCSDQIDALTVSRYMSDKLDAFVCKILKPVSKDFSVFLMFDRPYSQGSEDRGNSGFFLCGNVWPHEILDYNLGDKDIPEGIDVIPEILKVKNLEKILGGSGSVEVVQDLVKWVEQPYSDDNENITNRTRTRLDAVDADTCREVSLFEFIFSSGKAFQSSWSSQSVKWIDTQDPRKAWVTLRKKEGNGDEDEETFIDPKTGTFWVEKQSDIKDYKQRPKEMDPLVLLQKAAHYRELERSNPNYAVKLNELRKSEGIEASTDVFVPLETNRTKYPNAPLFLPKFLLIGGIKILILLKNPNIVKFNQSSLPLTSLLLCEPWRVGADFDEMEHDQILLESVISRRKKILPSCSDDCPDTA